MEVRGNGKGRREIKLGMMEDEGKWETKKKKNQVAKEMGRE